MTVVFSYSKYGKEIGDKLEKEFSYKHYNSRQVDFKIKDYVKDNWEKEDAFIFISSTGIAVRTIKDFIISKDIDPAIIVLDDASKNVISLLSGHLGGANELTRKIAGFLGANPVITTSTDNHNIEAVDEFARKNSCHIPDPKKILAISKMMLEDKTVGFYSEIDKTIGYKNIKKLDSFDKLEGIDGLIVVSKTPEQSFNLPSIWLYPKIVNLGIGCRKDTPAQAIIDFVEAELDKLNISRHSIGRIGSVEAKRNEKGLLEAGEYFGRELVIFSNDQIKTVEDKFDKSDFVKKTIGVYSVAEPCAYLLGGRLLTKRLKKDGITLAISLEDK